jgi:aspartate/methionine/tyrosine aminotransferase
MAPRDCYRELTNEMRQGKWPVSAMQTFGAGEVALRSDSIAVTTGMGGEAYAQWVRRAIRNTMAAQRPAIPLFDSSVEEPTELLRRTIMAGFVRPITSRYQSVFVNGNPYVVEKLASRYGVAEERVLCTTGATSALSLVYRAYLSPGDHILVETPGFDLFADIARSLGARVGFFRRRGPEFGIDVDEVAAMLEPDTRLVVLSNLHNPSGMLLSDRELEALADAVTGRGVKLIVDEVYGDYADCDARPGSAVRLSPDFIGISSLTKIYGLSTLRCGWVVADPEALAPVRRVSDHFEFGVSKLAHAVSALILEDSTAFDENSQQVLASARPVIEHFFGDWVDAGLVDGALPKFGCISFPKLVGIEDTKEFSAWLADSTGVIVAPGEFFGAPGHIRIGHAHPPDVLERGLAQLTGGLRAYRVGRSGRRADA